MKSLFLLLFISIFIISCNNDSSPSNIDYCKDNPCKDSTIANKTTCEETDNDFKCVCNEGYELNADTNLCIHSEVDLCKDLECQENSECKIVVENSTNLAKCICDIGYSLDTDSNTCVVIEESSFYKNWTDDSYTENSGVSLTLDNDNNILVVGYQSSKMVWDEVEQKEIATESDTTLRKFSSKGELIWEKAWNDDEYDFPVGIVSDSKGNYFIAGEKGGDTLRAFLVKINSEGNKVWTKEWSCNDGLLVWDLAIDNDDSLYITGRIYSNFSNTSKVGGISDSFLIKVSNDTEAWIKQWGTTKMDEGKAIIVKGDNIFVLTENNGDTDIEDTLGSIKWDFNITKFDKSGNILSDTNWMKGLIDTYVVDFSIDNNNNYYIIGDSPKNFDGHVNQGDNDIFLIKLDNTLTKQWSKLIGTAYYDTTNTIVNDSEGNILIGGHSYGSFEGFTNPGEGIESDSLLIKVKNDGEILSYNMYSSDNRLAGESISKIIIQNDNLIFTGVENADYIADTQNLKSWGYLRKILKSEY